MSARLTQLQTLLAKSPNDPFLLYAAALELKKLGDAQPALDHLHKTLQQDPDYLYAYYQQGQILETLGDTANARIAYDEGIRRAKARGDGKALGELQQARGLLD